MTVSSELLRPALVASIFLAWGGPPPLCAQVADATRVVRSLGEIDGPPGRVFHAIGSVEPLPGGRLLIADGGSHQIRVYGPDADPLFTFGREGQGPGEFTALTWVAPYRGDSLVAWDAGPSRLTILDGSGELGRTITLAGGGAGIRAAGDPRAGAAARLDVVGPTAGGGFVARRGDIHVGPGDTTAVRRDPFAFVLLDPEGASVRELVTLPDDEQFVWAEGGSRSVRPRAFGRVTATDVAGSRFAWAQNDGFRATVLDLATGAERTLEADRAARPVRDADRRLWIEANAPERDAPAFARTNWERTLEAMPFPESLPWHGDLVLAADGAVWLEEYRPDPSAPAVWTVLDGGAPGSRRVRFPAGFRLSSVEDGHAYGVSVGEFDVQRVTVIRLPLE